ncbi:MAG: shikimate dehydrogenase [Gammaproteobacteria bacterium]|nr:shikimate dehydrogenase [Gammaproteobacteria bacterium]
MSHSVDRYAVMGFPIEHSRSPEIHLNFAAQMQQALEYTRIEVQPEDFSTALNAFQDSGGKGLNITVPLKELAWRACLQRDEFAERAKAVNTIRFNADGTREGFNTDGIGLVRDLTKHQIELPDKRILILGAGGAVRGILAPLLQQSPAELVIANRTLSKAQQLVSEFEDLGFLHAVELNNVGKYAYDIIINATSSGLYNECPNIAADAINSHTVIYDMVYGKETAFIQWAKTQGATQTFDGMGMLIEQAAEAFRIWRGVLPNTQNI